MSTAEVPSDAARRQFVAKLNQFRGSLEANEQQMLDALVQLVQLDRPQRWPPRWGFAPPGGSSRIGHRSARKEQTP